MTIQDFNGNIRVKKFSIDHLFVRTYECSIAQNLLDLNVVC